jgi:hypothetical protein
VKRRSFEERLFEKIREDESGCWIFTGAHNGAGYGKISAAGGDDMLAHRATWELFYGPIPPGLVVDHLCRVKRCVNPWHLDIVTQRVNSRRALLLDHAARETCINGHPWAAGNDYLDPRGVHQCRACRRELGKARAAERRAVA